MSQNQVRFHRKLRAISRDAGHAPLCRASFPEAIQTVFTRFYPFGWLGILMQAPLKMGTYLLLLASS